ncbi:MAG: hypothetical protein HKN12_04070 [Gemmatimonadetes bacterium]|nr:hypothetical protein [Gemmatimonadota bacterium]
MRWGVSYFGVRDPRHVRTDLDEIAGAGFTSVTHTFSEHDLRFHTEDMARIVEESRTRGLEVGLDPWGVGGLFGGEAYSELALRNLACRQVDAEGRWAPACCPNAPATVELLERWARTATELGADVLFWDEPHFHFAVFGERAPAPCCRCEACAAAWTEHGGAGGLPPEGDPRLGPFRSRSLRRLMEAGIAAADAAGSVRHSLCLLPRGEFADAGTDAWDDLATIPGLSRLATDPYWMSRDVVPREFVRKHADLLRPVCDSAGCEMEIWIQGIRIPAGQEAVIGEACDAAAEAGAESIAFWSFRGTDRMGWLTCGDPDAAWAAMCDAVRKRS